MKIWFILKFFSFYNIFRALTSNFSLFCFDNFSLFWLLHISIFDLFFREEKKEYFNSNKKKLNEKMR